MIASLTILGFALAAAPPILPSAAAQDQEEHAGGHEEDPDAHALEEKYENDPDGIIYREIQRARADESQWGDLQDVAAAEAAGAFGRLTFDRATGVGTGAFVAFELDASHGAWNHLRVASTAHGETVEWLARVQAEPFTSAHGPIVTGPTIRLFCGEEVATLHDTPEGAFTLRAVVETLAAFVPGPGAIFVPDGPRSFLLERGDAHAHLFFGRGQATVEGGSVLVRLPGNETATFRVHAGPGAPALHDANAALALSQLGTDVLAVASNGGPLELQSSWGADADVRSIAPEGGEWSIKADDGGPTAARFVIAAWPAPVAFVTVDGERVSLLPTWPEGQPVGPPAASGTVGDGTVDVWVRVPAGTHSVAISSTDARVRDTPWPFALFVVGILAMCALGVPRWRTLDP